MRHRLEWSRGVGREEVGHLVLTIGCQVLLADADLESNIGHAQRHEPLLHFGFHLLGGFRAQLCQRVSFLLALCFQLLHLLLALPKCFVAVVDMV